MLSKRQIESASARPTIPKVCWRTVPKDLGDIPHWVLWRYVRSKDGRWTKVLRYPAKTLAGDRIYLNASSTDPASWSTVDRIASHYWSVFAAFWGDSRRYGAGFCLSNADPEQTVTVIDLDDCRNRDTGELTTRAAELVTRFSSYTEVSPSGTGLKIYMFGRKPGPRCKNAKEHPGIEIFDNARFVAITGLHLPGTPLHLVHAQAEIDALYAELFPERPKIFPCEPRAGTAEPAAACPVALNLSDQDIIDRASKARNGAKFQALWRGDFSSYPSRSEADFALAGMLAFYVGPDIERVESLMRQSGLRRAKWDRPGLLRSTIARALESRTSFYGTTSFSTISDLIGTENWEVQLFPNSTRMLIGPPGPDDPLAVFRPPAKPYSPPSSSIDDLTPEVLANTLDQAHAEAAAKEAAAHAACGHTRASTGVAHQLRCPRLRSVIQERLDGMVVASPFIPATASTAMRAAKPSSTSGA